MQTEELKSLVHYNDALKNIIIITESANANHLLNSVYVFICTHNG